MPKKTKAWSPWKREGSGLFIREKGEFAAIDGQRQFKFTQGIKKGNGQWLTPRQRALDWKKGSPRNKGSMKWEIKSLNESYSSKSRIGAVKKVKGGYQYTETNVLTVKKTKKRGR